MSIRSWFRGSSAASNTPRSSSKAATLAKSVPGTPEFSGGSGNQPSTATAQQECSDIEDAMAAIGLIMNDDIDGAESRLRLRENGSTFHMLGLGLATFIKSILGFEKEMMAEAGKRLAEAENKAWSDQKKVQKEGERPSASWYSRVADGTEAKKSNGDGTVSNIYPPGSEFALVYAMTQLMIAVVSVMNESLTEAVKGFYKLRKAFVTLDGIMASEEQHVEKLRKQNLTLKDDLTKMRLSDKMGSSSSESDLVEAGKVDAAETKEGGEKEEFLDTPEALLAIPSKTQTPARSASPSSSLGKDEAPLATLERRDTFSSDPTLFTTTVDVFVHSGTNMCFGTLMLLISMVPPAFSRLLQVIGFKGDRVRGVDMLWKSTQYQNICGAMAGLVLLAYYNGLLGFADIAPTEKDIEELAEEGEMVGYPEMRCSALLANMRSQFPESRLWKLEEARVLANSRRLKEACEMLVANADSKMRQVTALNSFELSMNSMYMMDWEGARQQFLRCIELNDWSHALYYYMAGAAELELYRSATSPATRLTVEGEERHELESLAGEHKKLAKEYFRKAPTVAGRKRFMARQMPFEVFVTRKLQKWEERAASLGLDLVDAVAISPALEMVYLWNGTKRMSTDLLEDAQTFLAWDRCTADEEKLLKIKEEKDEVAIQAIVRSALLREQGKVSEAREAVQPVVDADRLVFKGPTRDDYCPAAAHYEMAAVAWIESSNPKFWPKDKAEEDVEAFRRKGVDECEAYLTKVSKWEGFVLDARFGMRVQAGVDTIKWLKDKKGWVST